MLNNKECLVLANVFSGSLFLIYNSISGLVDDSNANIFPNTTKNMSSNATHHSTSQSSSTSTEADVRKLIFGIAMLFLSVGAMILYKIYCISDNKNVEKTALLQEVVSVTTEDGNTVDENSCQPGAGYPS